MPGIIAFRRRWSVGSDDLVVPGLFLFSIHLIWLIVLSVIFGVVEFNAEAECVALLWEYLIGYVIVIVVSVLLELMISLTALRGSILDTEERKAIPGLIYIRLGILLVEMVWLVLGGMWIAHYYKDCPVSVAKEALLGLVICNWLVILSFFITLWCTFDPAGRSWVKMMNYQRSMKAAESRFQYRRSGSCTRTWRHRKVLRAYQNSWDQRCRLLFCCMRRSDRSQNSFGDIARLLSDFFRDIDVVPSDVVAGLILLRKYQKIERESIVKQRLNNTYEYLSGVPVTSGTQFLPLNDPVYYAFFQDVIHYMTFALGAYGWPMYVMNNPSATLCELCVKLRCSCFPCCRTNKSSSATIIKDNCCQCNYAALKQQVETKDVEIVYATFHVDVGITPFFVAIDYARKKIIVSIRGTLSLQDVITDLNAEGEPIPINPPKEDWLGHKGMIQVAVHIQNKLMEESILQQALNFNPQRGTQDFKLVIVGHSLGAGAAAILSILLRQHYPDVVCFSYSPPGGTISMPAAEYTKSFITSVVVGKDVVPRIGLHQMESLRADLMHAIKRSKDPKWKTISCSVLCCGCAGLPTSAQELKADDSMQLQYKKDKDKAREFVFHSQTSNVALTSHQPLYPPGRIIHVVRHHTTRQEQVLRKRKPVYQALWAENTDFDEVLISPVMIQDHMPDNVLAALNKVVQGDKERTLIHSMQMAMNTAHVTTSPLRMTKQEIPDYVKEFEMLFFDRSAGNEIDDVVISIESNAGNGSDEGSGRESPPLRSGIVVDDTSLFQVITTVGPRKPQRTAAFTNSAIEPESQIDSECAQLLGNYPTSVTPKQNTPAHKLQLETSFTSLLSPNEKSTCKISLQSFGSHSSNCTNTVTTNSLVKNEYCFKQKGEIPTQGKSLIPWEYQSMLDDVKTVGECRLEFIHDEWFGLAPLATPESLSEVSSISSRASSVIIHQDRGKERWHPGMGHRRLPSNGLRMMKDNGQVLRNHGPLRNRQYENSDSSDSYLDSPPMNRNGINLKSLPSIDSPKSSSGELPFLNYGIRSPEHDVKVYRTQKSPRVMRRTPKIPIGLATAYEDPLNNQTFEEMMKGENHERNSSDTNSFASAKSQEFKSSRDILLWGSTDCVKPSGEEGVFSTPVQTAKRDECINHREYKRTYSGSEEDVNFHKPTQVIFPEDENFPCPVTDSCQAPYLETDFSLSDPELAVSYAREKKPRIKFEERVRSGVSFDQDYEFDIETESARLLNSNNASETSLCRSRGGLHAQDSLFRDEDSIEDKTGEDCLGCRRNNEGKTVSSQGVISSSGRRKADRKGQYASVSAEALPLLANISQECCLLASRGESSV